MPMYEFALPDGVRVERYYAPGGAPLIGEYATIDGKRARRLPPTLGSGPAVQVPNYQHEAFNMRNMRHGIDPDVPRYSPEGKPGLLGGFPLFKDKREIAEYEAKKKHKYGSTMEYRR